METEVKSDLNSLYMLTVKSSLSITHGLHPHYSIRNADTNWKEQHSVSYVRPTLKSVQPSRSKCKQQWLKMCDAEALSWL